MDKGTFIIKVQSSDVVVLYNVVYKGSVVLCTDDKQEAKDAFFYYKRRVGEVHVYESLLDFVTPAVNYNG